MKILIVDDEQAQREMLQGFLEKQHFQVISAGNGKEAVRLFEELPLQLVLLDHHMEGMNGTEVLARIKEINPQAKAIMITAFGAVDTAVRAMKLGANDFMEKPIDLTELLEKIRRIEEELVVEEEASFVQETLDASNLPLDIIGRSPAMTNILSMVRRIAPSPYTVLLRGETGTGKELIAKLIHLLSARKNAPFVTVNCAAIPENLFESELFGHEIGAFTGAVSSKKGRFELAQGGTLFLDEIGELPLNLQAKLLRALQEKMINRVGDEKEIAADVRLLAATNRNLKEMVENQHFREDLYFRLHVLEIELPPLRQRKEDIQELVAFFLNKFSLRPAVFSGEAMATLIKYSFPGNIRELEHIVQRTLTLARGKVIGLADLPLEVSSRSADTTGSLDEQLTQMERKLIFNALEKNNWVQTRAALELGISERVLRYKMSKYNLKKSQN